VVIVFECRLVDSTEFLVHQGSSVLAASLMHAYVLTTCMVTQMVVRFCVSTVCEGFRQYYIKWLGLNDIYDYIRPYDQLHIVFINQDSISHFYKLVTFSYTPQRHGHRIDV